MKILVFVHRCIKMKILGLFCLLPLPLTPASPPLPHTPYPLGCFQSNKSHGTRKNYPDRSTRLVLIEKLPQYKSRRLANKSIN